MSKKLSKKNRNQHFHVAKERPLNFNQLVTKEQTFFAKNVIVSLARD